MKGIILAAGRGTRLFPMTKPICKPLIPVYDKPLIYYPLGTLMRAGIRDILIIVPYGERTSFRNLLGNGSHLGIHIEYEVQKVQRGIADALVIGEDFVDNNDVALILGDNIFIYNRMEHLLKKAAKNESGATVFGYYVENPRPFGVVEIGEDGKAISIEEKPKNPKSNYIIPGLYFYDNQVMEIAKHLKPSARGEYEITDVNLEYMRRGQLNVVPLDRGVIWMDAGNADDVLEASQTIRALQKGGIYSGAVEEIAYTHGFISQEEVHALGEEMAKTNYGKYLMKLE